MEQYAFSLASHDDIPEIVDIYRSLVGTPGCTWDLEYPSRESAEWDFENKSLYVLKQNGKIVAAASAGDFNELGHLPWTPEHPCELARIGVMPSMQGRGVGTAILQSVMKAMREKGFDGIRMLVSKTNPAALALYEKNGFSRCGEVFMYDIDFFCYEIKFDTAV